MRRVQPGAALPNLPPTRRRPLPSPQTYTVCHAINSLRLPAHALPHPITRPEPRANNLGSAHRTRPWAKDGTRATAEVEEHASHVQNSSVGSAGRPRSRRGSMDAYPG